MNFTQAKTNRRYKSLYMHIGQPRKETKYSRLRIRRIPNLKSVKMKSDYNEILFSKFEGLVQVWFQKDTNVTKSEFNNDWIDPYDSIWLKMLSVILYAFEIFASLVMMTFVNYESAGYFGHYRTLINQLLSHLYGGVSIFLRLKCTDPAAPCAPCTPFM